MITREIPYIEGLKGAPMPAIMFKMADGKYIRTIHFRYVLHALKDCEFCEWIMLHKTLFTIYFMCK